MYQLRIDATHTLPEQTPFAAQFPLVLLPLKEKALLSYWIDAVPDDTRIEIVVKTPSPLLESYLRLAHPSRVCVVVEANPPVGGLEYVRIDDLQTPFPSRAITNITNALPYPAVTTYAEYETLHQQVHGALSYDYRKDNEFLYIVNQTVIKIFADADVATHRVTRSMLHSAFPSITTQQPHLYAYTWQPGETLYQRATHTDFIRLLDWLQTKFWSTPIPQPLTRADCEAFYREKTYQRLAMFRAKYPDFHPTQVNGTLIPETMERLLEHINWTRLCTEHLTSRGGFIHGDLQFDNILHTDTGFMFLDWRQDFAGHLTHGDIYYDVAKLNAGLILNHDLIKRRLFTYRETSSGVIEFDYARRATHERMREHLEAAFAHPMIDEIVTLIYLNMAPLHTAPYDKLLFALAAERLSMLY